jgi:hypothetical protein
VHLDKLLEDSPFDRMVGEATNRKGAGFKSSVQRSVSASICSQLWLWGCWCSSSQHEHSSSHIRRLVVQH